MSKEYIVDLSEDNNFDNEKIITYKLFCQISKSNITLIKKTGEKLKIACPYAIHAGYPGNRFYCNLQKTFWETKDCGIYEGMKDD